MMLSKVSVEFSLGIESRCNTRWRESTLRRGGGKSRISFRVDFRIPGMVLQGTLGRREGQWTDWIELTRQLNYGAA